MRWAGGVAFRVRACVAVCALALPLWANAGPYLFDFSANYGPAASGLQADPEWLLDGSFSLERDAFEAAGGSGNFSISEGESAVGDFRIDLFRADQSQVFSLGLDHVQSLTLSCQWGECSNIAAVMSLSVDGLVIDLLFRDLFQVAAMTEMQPSGFTTDLVLLDFGKREKSTFFGNYSVDALTQFPVPVPAPPAMVLMLLGLGFLAAERRFRTRP